MNPNDVQAVMDVKLWLEYIEENTFIAYGSVMPGVFQNYGEGIFVCISTPESAYHQNENYKHKTMIVPEYLHYDVFFHPGVAMFNWAGIGGGGYALGNFENFLDEMCKVAAIPDGRMTYRPKADQWHNESLQTLLAIFGIPMHVRIMAGLSRYGFRALDICTRVVVGQQPVALYFAHDLLYDSWVPQSRTVPYPPNLWKLEYRQHWGQIPTVCDWYTKGGVHLGALHGLLDRYTRPGGQQKTLEEPMIQCHTVSFVFSWLWGRVLIPMVCQSMRLLWHRYTS